MNAETKLFSCLRNAICGEKLGEEVIKACTQEQLEAVYVLAKKHDLAHIVAHALENVAVPECDVLQKLRKAKATAIYRYTQLEYELERICGILELGSIPFMPLKGSVLRPFYPEPWMRSSCDIDVLVKEEDLWQAVSMLENSGFRRVVQKSKHDISLYAPCGVHLELHHTLVKYTYPEQWHRILNNAWEQADQKKGTKYQYIMTDAMYYYSHMAHLAGHILFGGCGIKMIMDMWVLNNRKTGDKAVRDMLLEQGKLLYLAKETEKLAECWFSGIPMDNETKCLASYFINSGTYGTNKNKIVLQKLNTTKGKTDYRRVVLPLSEMRCYYPVLDKKPWLLPIYQVRRWFRVVKARWERLQRELAGQNVSRKAEEEMQNILRYLDL